MQNRIAVVIVTFNRLSSLKNCLRMVKEQTLKPDAIIIVNNGSTDGTLEWLNMQKNITILNQANLGSGGGQFLGMKYAYENNFDWVWCMDDDGYPQDDTLEKLVSNDLFKEKFVLGSLVLSIDNSEKLSFYMPILDKGFSSIKYYPKMTDNKVYLTELNPKGLPWGAFFNSVLIPKQCFEICGFPKAELFIWGDEVEYFYRVKSIYGKVWLVPTSLFYHPKAQINNISKWKEKYLHRNKVYIQRKYYPFFYLRLLIRLLYVLVNRKFYLLRPIYDGLIERFDNRYHL